MRIRRHFTVEGHSPYQGITFKTASSEIRNPDGSIVFAQDDASLQLALACKAGAILVRTDTTATDDPRVLRVRDPRYAMALAAKALAAPPTAPAIHPSAIIHPSAELGVGVRVGPAAVIEANAIIGECSVIAARVTIHQGVRLGSRVVVQSGAVLGALGFGYARNRETGEYLLFPQQGTLIIEDDVEVGAGDIIMTGTPAGVAALSPGDKIECGVDGIGTLKVSIGKAAG